MTDGKVITNAIDGLAVLSNIIESANNEVVYISPPSLLVLASQFNLTERTKAFIQKRGRMRGVTNISYSYIGEMRDFLDNGVDVRHISQYQGIFLLVADKKESISLMNIDVESLSIDAPLVALWNHDPIYAEYLMSTFELVWEQAIPAEQRIEELLKEGSPEV